MGWSEAGAALHEALRSPRWLFHCSVVEPGGLGVCASGVIFSVWKLVLCSREGFGFGEGRGGALAEPIVAECNGDLGIQQSSFQIDKMM